MCFESKAAYISLPLNSFFPFSQPPRLTSVFFLGERRQQGRCFPGLTKPNPTKPPIPSESLFLFFLCAHSQFYSAYLAALSPLCTFSMGQQWSGFPGARFPHNPNFLLQILLTSILSHHIPYNSFSKPPVFHPTSHIPHPISSYCCLTLIPYHQQYIKLPTFMFFPSLFYF